MAERASEAYTALLEGAGTGGSSGAAFIDSLTGLFKDIVSALDANASLVAETFGQPALLDVALALHEECDVHGARILQRYAQHRGLATLVQVTTMVHASPAKDGGAAALSTSPAPVDPRQVESYLEEILILYQRSEEYNQYALACMANAVAPDALGGKRENAFRSGQFNITVRELVSSYINLVSTGVRLGSFGRGEGRGRGPRKRRACIFLEGLEVREGSGSTREPLPFFLSFQVRRTPPPSALLSPHASPTTPHHLPTHHRRSITWNKTSRKPSPSTNGVRAAYSLPWWTTSFSSSRSRAGGPWRQATRSALVQYWARAMVCWPASCGRPWTRGGR